MENQPVFQNVTEQPNQICEQTPDTCFETLTLCRHTEVDDNVRFSGISYFVGLLYLVYHFQINTVSVGLL